MAPHSGNGCVKNILKLHVTTAALPAYHTEIVKGDSHDSDPIMDRRFSLISRIMLCYFTSEIYCKNILLIYITMHMYRRNTRYSIHGWRHLLGSYFILSSSSCSLSRKSCDFSDFTSWSSLKICFSQVITLSLSARAIRVLVRNSCFRVAFSLLQGKGIMD